MCNTCMQFYILGVIEGGKNGTDVKQGLNFKLIPCDLKACGEFSSSLLVVQLHQPPEQMKGTGEGGGANNSICRSLYDSLSPQFPLVKRTGSFPIFYVNFLPCQFQCECICTTLNC
uniref:Uncharacterized protein n=1 Tax=Sphaerodactylus townsendi TaxID=933632 RepID=A0ACB8FLK0_9SAUR